MADKDWFALDSSRQQIAPPARSRAFGPEAGGRCTSDTSKTRSPAWRRHGTPRRVFLFSGPHDRRRPPQARRDFPPTRNRSPRRRLAPSSTNWAWHRKTLPSAAAPAEATRCLPRPHCSAAAGCSSTSSSTSLSFFRLRSPSLAKPGSTATTAIKDNPLARVKIQPDELGPLPKAARSV